MGSESGRKPGIHLHRTKQLSKDELTRVSGIPVTTPARTIIDVAPGLRTASLEQLIAAAHRQRPANTRALEVLIPRYPRRPGVPAICRILARGPRFTRSKPERRLLEALRRAGFGEPETNVPLAGHEVDILLRERRIVVEVDGEPFHSARPDRRRGYERDALLQALGFAVIRVDADDPPERAIARIKRIPR